MTCIDFAQGAIAPVIARVDQTTPVSPENLFQCDQFGVRRTSGQMSFIVGEAQVPRVLVCLAGAGQLEHAGAAYAFGKVTFSACPPWWEPALVGRMVSSACWKCLCHALHKVVKNLIVFDLDGTLAESKSSIDTEMADLLDRLLAIVKVAVISGGAWPQFEKRVLAHLRRDDCLNNLSLLPTCGTKFYRHAAGWQQLYSEDFTETQKKTITDSLQQAIAGADCRVEKVRGEVIYPAKQAGALSIEVDNPHETKRVIEAIVACLGNG